MARVHRVQSTQEGANCVLIEFFERWMLFLSAFGCVSFVLGSWLFEYARHQRLIKHIPIRVHVNGIRGKSSLVRMIAGALRQGGIETIAKTTGSATRVIDKNGEDQAVFRPGAPTIVEQVSLMKKYVEPSTQAIVFECMAINPDYQYVAEHKIIKATDGVILNVKHDHEEALGWTIPDIAASLGNTVPGRSDLYTGSIPSDASGVLFKIAEQRSTRMHQITGDNIDPNEIRDLGPFVFPENVEIAVAIAEKHGVSRADALRGIRESNADPGASKLFRHEFGDQTLFWIDLFGVNDTDSVAENVDRVIQWLDEDPALYVVLNSRSDRPDRAEQFAEFLADGLKFKGVILVGDYQSEIQDRLLENGVSQDSITRMIEDTEDAFEQVLDDILSKTSNQHIAMVGLANIHTTAADIIRTRLEQNDGASDMIEDQTE